MRFEPASRHHRWCLAVSFAVVLLMPLARARADEASPIHFDDVEWQSAAAADMAVFDPYIGAFRGTTQKADDGTEFFYAITYAWFNRQHTVVRFAIEVRIPSRGEARPLGEGFYYHDPFLDRLAVSGFFRDGRVGSGYMTPFDTTAHTRTVRIHSRQPDGAIVEVRDTFWVIDADSWGNRTYVGTDANGWQVVSDEVFTRIEEKAPAKEG